MGAFDGGAFDPVAFDVAGGSTDAQDVYKSILLRQSLPPSFNRTRGSGFSKTLAAVGESDNNIGGLFGKANFYGETALPADGTDRSAISQARDSMLLDTATGVFLTNIGANHGVPRPPQSPFDDELYRRIIPVLGWLPKVVYLVTYRLAEAIFGTQQSVLALFGHTWQIFEVNPNEVIFECPADLITGTATTAAYLHGYPGTIGSVIGPTNIITFVGDDASLSASTGSLIGLTIYIFHTNAWQTYTINMFSYNASTNTNTISLSASTVPTGNGYPFFIDVPGASSWNPGDFMLSDPSVPAGGTNPDIANLVYLYGKGKLDIFEFYFNNFTRAAGVSLRSEVI